MGGERAGERVDYRTVSDGAPGQLGQRSEAANVCEIMNGIVASCTRLTPDAYENMVMHRVSSKCRRWCP